MLDKIDSSAKDRDKIISLRKSLAKYRIEAANNQRWGFNLSLEEFIEEIGILNPQSYGFRVAKYLSEKLSLINSDDPDRGDKMTIYFPRKYFEFKGSIITSSNQNLNLVQIRLWQKINGYVIWVIDNRDDFDSNITFMYMSYNDLKYEISNLKTSSAHGTAKANANNLNVEMAIRLKFNDTNYLRLYKKYGTSFSDLKSILQ